MPMQASTDRDLARAGSRRRQTATRLLGGGILLSGVGLWLPGAVSGRASRHKPFA